MATLSMFTRCIALIAILSITPSVFAANILISTLYGEGSHFTVGASVGIGLADRGHNVTCLISRAYERVATDERYTKLSFEMFDHRDKTVEEVQDFFNSINTLALRPVQEQIAKSDNIISTLADDCRGVLLDEALMSRMDVIDTIVMDISWPCGMLIKHILQRNSNNTKRITTISITPPVTSATILSTYGSTYNPAYQPEVTTGYTNRMTFLQRTLNLFRSLLITNMLRHFSLPVYTKIARDFGLDEKVGDIGAYGEYFDLYLLNLDFSSEFPFPLTPNIIPVGGLTARPAGRIEDKDLREFMDNSGDDGVIVFTLGTYFASVTKIWPEFTEAFAEAFRRLPQRVVWQLTELPAELELPPNVMTMPWVPQNDLLGHPQTRLFLYQGGNNGFQEACYHGVPTVVVPLHCDQYDVAARVEARGMGRQIDKFNLDTDIIVEVLSDVINDQMYTKAARQVSATMRDNPMSPRDRAVFWIEHVIKYGGDHLKSSATELSFIQYHMLDVIAFLSACIFIILLILFYIMRSCFRLCYRTCFTGRGLKEKSKQE